MATLFELCFASFKQEVRDYLDRYDALSAKLRAINRKKNTCFSDWEIKHLNYLYAVYKNKLNIRRRQNRQKALSKQFKTAASFELYRKQHPYGEVDGWITNPISKLTGMQACDEESWNEFDFEEKSVWPDYRYRKWSFANEIDEFDVGPLPPNYVPRVVEREVARNQFLLRSLHDRLRDLRTQRAKKQARVLTYIHAVTEQKPYEDIEWPVYGLGHDIDDIIKVQYTKLPDPRVVELHEALKNPPVLPHREELIRLMEEREEQLALDHWQRLEQEFELDPPDNVVYPEMMEAEHTDNLMTEKQGNVVLSEENPSEPAVGVLQDQNSIMWNQMSSNEKDSVFNDLTSRWTLWSHLTWKVQDAKNDLLEGFSLPHDFIASAQIAAGTMPLFLPFKIFKYVKTDMEIKIHINSNKFQTGQLQCSWQYMEHYDKYASMNTIYARSQLPHVIVNAGSSNEATLYIPYKYINPYMCTQSKKTGLSCLDMGDLDIRVITPLQTVDAGPHTASITLFIRFPNCAFTGMRDGSIVDAEMLSAVMAGMEVKREFDKVMKDYNCDNPSVNSAPSYLVPTGSHSWSAGTGIREPLHTLRLDVSAVGVGRTGIDSSETAVSVPLRTFGLFHSFKWSSADNVNNQYGHVLFKCDAHPQLQKDLFPAVPAAPPQMKVYQIPPISVISSLFQNWRGSIEFRFDIVCNQFYTGRLLIAYIPGYTGTKDVTIAQARNSPCAEFDLQNSNTFVFTVPYISDRPWWFRKYGGPQRRTEFSAPSKVFLYVLNPLVTMESIPNEITLNVYVRAGVDFEVSVPVQPAVGLSYNADNIIGDDENCSALAGHYPWWVTNWRGFGDSKKYVLYYGSSALGSACMMYFPDKVYNQVSSLTERKFVYWTVLKADEADIPKVVWSAGSAATPVKYLVLVPQDNWVMGLPFPANKLDAVKKVAEAVARKRKQEVWLPDCMEFVEDSIECVGNPRFAPTIEPWAPGDFVMVQPEAGEDRFDSNNVLQPLPMLPSTGFGKFTYNEAFGDLKDLMRRYQLYLSLNIPIPKYTYLSGNAFLQFPAVPIGLDLDITNKNEIWNSLRDGAIPIILSGYLFFRGSLRYRVVLSSDSTNLEGAKVWIQHHPDMALDYGASYRVGKKIMKQDRYKNHNYGFYIQAMSVNSIIEFEVPFYQQGMYGYLQPVRMNKVAEDINDYVSLGDVVMGIHCGKMDKDYDAQIEVYYSIGDDFSASVFRGFPPVIFCDEVWTENVATPEMWSFFSSAAASWAGNHLGARLSDLSSDVAGKAKVALAKEIKSQIKPEITNIENALYDMKNSTESKIGEWFKVTALSTAFGNLMHVLANPTWQTVAISMANIVLALIGGGLQVLCTIKDVFSEFFKKYWNIFSGPSQVPVADSRPTIVYPEMGEEEWYEGNEWKMLLSLILTGVAGLVGCTRKDASYFSTMRDVAITASLSTNILNFLRNMNDIIVAMFKWCIRQLDPQADLEGLLENSAPTIKAWFKEVQFLLDARNKPRYAYDRSMLARVFDASVYGSLLVSNNLDKASPSGRVIWDLYKEICKLRNEFIERGAHPDVRFEPFTMYIHGPPGAGKSYLTPDLINHLLREINYQGKGSLIYYISPMLKHWSGVQQPAALVSDDIFQVAGTQTETELSNLFNICSSSVLNPPMAAVEDKERRLNPLIYLMHSNMAFPNLGSVMRCPRAVYRRRKKLIEMDYTEEVKAAHPNLLDASQLERQQLENFQHLRFRIAVDPSSSETAYGRWMSYQELKQEITPQFVRHYTDERNNFAQRMRLMYSLDPDFHNLDLIEEIPALRNIPSLTEQVAEVQQRLRARLAAYDDPRNDVRNADLDGDDMAWYQRLWNSFRTIAFPEADEFEEVDPTAVTPRQRDIWLDDDYFSEMFIKDEAGLFVHRDLNHIVDSYKVRNFSNFQLLTAWIRSICFVPSLAQKYFSTMDYNRYSKADILQMVYLSMGPFCDLKVGGGVTTVGTKMAATNYFMWLGSYFNLAAFDSAIFTSDDCIEVINSDEMIGKLLRNMLDNDYNLFRRELMKLLRDEAALREFMIENMDGVNCLTKLFIAVYKMGAGSCNAEVISEELRKDPGSATSILMVKHWLTEMEFMCDEAFCCHRGIYKDMLRDITNVSWNARQKQYVYTNCFGLRQFTTTCTCPRSLVGNEMFLDMFATYYNRMNVESIKVGSKMQVEMKRPINVVEAEAWLDKIANRVTCWWQGYISPWIGELLTALINWLPTILAMLGMLYLYFRPADIAEKSDLIVSEVASGVIPVTEEDLIGKFSPEGQNYFKFDKPKATAKRMPKIAPRNFSKPESGARQKLTVAKKLEANTVIMRVSWPEEGGRYVKQGRCLMLYGRKMLVLRHYLEQFSAVLAEHPEQQIALYFNVGGKSSSIWLYPEQILDNVTWAQVKGSFKTTNYGIVELPPQVPQFKNILSLIATKAMHEVVPTTADMLSVAGENVYNLRVTRKAGYIIAEQEDSSEVVLDSIYTYQRRGKGLCGSVLIAENLCGGNGGIFAMHVAGNERTGEGVAEPLYREMFETIKRLDPTPEINEMPLLPLEEANLELEGNLLLYGCVPKNFAHVESGVSKIVPSVLHGTIYPVLTEPNPLKPNDPRQPPGSHPLRDGCRKHGSGMVRPFPLQPLEMATDALKEHISQVCVPVRQEIKPLTLQQATCGDVQIDHFEPLNWKSSEGFPLSNFRPATAHDKRWLFNLEDTENGYILKGVHEKLQERLNIRNLCFKENKYPVTIYEDCLKDYKMPPEKCAIPGKTRIFSIAPVEVTIDIRMYLNDFTAAYKNAKIVNMAGIGINPDSMDWTQLVNFLFEVGQNVITLDYKNFGPCLMSQCVVKACDVIVHWFEYYGATEEHVKRVKWILYNDILNPIHLGGNVVYQTLNGIASGSPITAELNSLVNNLYIMVAWVEIMRLSGMDWASDLSVFFENVRLVVYGDDLIMTVSNEYVEKFNAITIREFFLGYGIEVTSAAKDAKLEKYESLLYSTFLKRSFAPHPYRHGVWLGPVDVKSVTETLNWIRDCNDINEATVENCRASLDLAYSHGPGFYLTHSEKIKHQLARLSIPFKCKTWHTRDMEIFDVKEGGEGPPKLECKLPWVYYQEGL